MSSTLPPKVEVPRAGGLASVLASEERGINRRLPIKKARNLTCWQNAPTLCRKPLVCLETNNKRLWTFSSPSSCNTSAARARRRNSSLAVPICTAQVRVPRGRAVATSLGSRRFPPPPIPRRKSKSPIRDFRASILGVAFKKLDPRSERQTKRWLGGRSWGKPLLRAVRRQSTPSPSVLLTLQAASPNFVRFPSDARTSFLRLSNARFFRMTFGPASDFSRMPTSKLGLGVRRALC